MIARRVGDTHRPGASRRFNPRVERVACLLPFTAEVFKLFNLVLAHQRDRSVGWAALDAPVLIQVAWGW